MAALSRHSLSVPAATSPIVLAPPSVHFSHHTRSLPDTWINACLPRAPPTRSRRVASQVVSLRQQTSSIAIPTAPPTQVESTRTFFYEGVIFDMDGTLTEAHIDFADMRARAGIPRGDLFTVMEAWHDPAQIKASMDVILDIEAEAAKKVKAKDGLMPLLKLLRERKVRVALVTRNTTASVSAFLDLIGPDWADIFSPVLTREFAFVKPDKRLLLHVAEMWDCEPCRLLMVGDSLEDVEVGNAAGTATCLVAGGGNEKPGAAPVAPPAGAVATFTVSGLQQLADQLQYASDHPTGACTPEDNVARDRWTLEQAVLNKSADQDNGVNILSLEGMGEDGDESEEEDRPLPAMVSLPGESGLGGWAVAGPAGLDVVEELSQAVAVAVGADLNPPLAGRVRLGWPVRVAAGETVLHEGAPPPGLAFLDWLVVNGALRPGACSFPKMGAAAGGLATCPPEQQGDKVLHLCCGDGALTKMLASQGMSVVGVDENPEPACRRGLTAVGFSSPAPLAGHSLMAAKAAAGQVPFDVVLLCGDAESCDAGGRHPVLDQWWTGEALRELQGAMHEDGRLCAQVTLAGGRAGMNPAMLINSLNSSGMTVVAWQLLRVPQQGRNGQMWSCGPDATQLRLVARRHDM